MRSSSISTSTTEPARVRFRSQKSVWLTSGDSQAYVFKLFTCFYAIFIVIAGIVIELSNLIGTTNTETKTSFKDLVLGIWLFGGSIAFIIYCAYLVYQMHLRVMRHRQTIRRSGNSLEEPEPEVLANTSTGSLYLRIGCVIFGMIGVVYYLLIFIICILGWTSNEGECTVIADSLNMAAAVFLFLQMWFVYCNGKIVFTGDGNLARFGLMHLTGTNLWMWLRYILYEEVETIKEIRHHEHLHSHPRIRETNGTDPEDPCQGVLCLFNGYNEFMYTCVVEYSLICAGVAFVFWTNIERFNRGHIETKMKKRSILKIDCSRTSEGLFAGFACIIVTIISIALFNAYSTKKDVAQWIFACTNMMFFLVSTILVIFAFWRMKFLKFLIEDDDEEDDNAELLDRILLVVGLIGELIFAIGGILSFVNNMTIGLPLIIFITNILRLIQVTLQSGLIIVAAKLRIDANDAHMLRYKPGKQVITMLLMMNCAQFLMNIFEAQKAGINDEMISMYGSYYWAIIVRGCSPLTIFYRFHSSACFAEVWKKTFKPPKKPKGNNSRHF
ncbi:unnamed protein product [Caenorhabditis angaria]|uniref:Uncharacterized protein n=1 Tax=Caenorhabditis angaria TaxID=860376 RepID=A0A9P1N8C2_9PELO|nr:unnamed protein product [Caenorhabditis angaria]